MPLTIEGDGLHFRDFIHVSDAARGLVMAYQAEGAKDMSINIGSGRAISIKEVANLVSLDSQMHTPERANDLVGTLSNTCNAKRLLGFETRKEFRTEMRREIERPASTQ